MSKSFFDLPALYLLLLPYNFFNPQALSLYGPVRNAGDLAVCLTSLRYAQAGGFGLQYGV
jgi:hypothetical protein